MSVMKNVFMAIAVVVLLTGCGKHYWSRPGGSLSDFKADSQECARAVAIPTSTDKEFGIVRSEYYRMCLKSRGWVRGQHPEPVPAGWYRGFEDDEIVKLDALPEQPEIAAPSSSSWSNLPPCERGGGFNARDSQGRWRCRP